MRRRLLYTSFAILLGPGAALSEMTEEPLLESGKWAVALRTESATGQHSCAVTSKTPQGQEFSMVSLAGKAPFAYVFDPALSIPPGPARLEITIGARKFSVSGRSMTTSVGFPLAWGAGAWGPDFTAALAAGSRMRIEAGAPQAPIDFDLTGSGAALKSFFECSATLE